MSDYSKIINYSWHCEQCICNYKQTLTQPRVERMLHSMLTSRVVLHIREQAAEDSYRSVGLTELDTIHFS
jgi:hypothetical protein